jgi:hypothetical protein
MKTGSGTREDGRPGNTPFLARYWVLVKGAELLPQE